MSFEAFRNCGSVYIIQYYPAGCIPKAAKAVGARVSLGSLDRPVSHSVESMKAVRCSPFGDELLHMNATFHQHLGGSNKAVPSDLDYSNKLNCIFFK